MESGIQDIEGRLEKVKNSLTDDLPLYEKPQPLYN